MTDGPQGFSEEIIHLRAVHTPSLDLHPFLIKIRLLSKSDRWPLFCRQESRPPCTLDGELGKFFIVSLFFQSHYVPVCPGDVF